MSMSEGQGAQRPRQLALGGHALHVTVVTGATEGAGFKECPFWRLEGGYCLVSLRFQGVGGGRTRARGEVTQKWLSWDCVLGGPCLGLSDRPERMAEELSPPLPPSGSLVSTPGGTQSELSSDRATRKRNWRVAGGHGSFRASLDLCPLG